jgi:hypothetical protein
VPRSAPAASPAPAPAPAPANNAGRSQDRGNSGQADRSSSGGNTSSNAPGRHRDDLPKTGDAVARGSSSRPPNGGHGDNGGGGSVIVSYPWFGYGAYYGGYYGYDPWTGWDPSYGSSSPASDGEGSVRLKIKPVEATVYVDGYYVGIVDEFDGVFQRLRLDAGPHRIETRAPDYNTLSFDVLVQPDHTTTLRGEMTPRTQN